MKEEEVFYEMSKTEYEVIKKRLRNKKISKEQAVEMLSLVQFSNCEKIVDVLFSSTIELWKKQGWIE